MRSRSLDRYRWPRRSPRRPDRSARGRPRPERVFGLRASGSADDPLPTLSIEQVDPPRHQCRVDRLTDLKSYVRRHPRDHRRLPGGQFDERIGADGLQQLDGGSEAADRRLIAARGVEADVFGADTEGDIRSVAVLQAELGGRTKGDPQIR